VTGAGCWSGGERRRVLEQRSSSEGPRAAGTDIC